jgi:hypothetical protein
MALDVLFGVGLLVTRFLLILAGVLLCFLGYRLFQQVPTSTGHAEVSLSEHLKFNLSKVGPGVFFALFGAAILIQALANPVKLERELGAGGALPTRERVVMAGQREVTSPDAPALTAEELQRQMRFMNGMTGLLRDNLPMERRVTFENDLREAKLALVAAGWDKRWGDFPGFASWARGQSSSEPNPGAKAIWEAR